MKQLTLPEILDFLGTLDSQKPADVDVIINHYERDEDKVVTVDGFEMIDETIHTTNVEKTLRQLKAKLPIKTLGDILDEIQDAMEESASMDLDFESVKRLADEADSYLDQVGFDGENTRVRSIIFKQKPNSINYACINNAELMQLMEPFA